MLRLKENNIAVFEKIKFPNHFFFIFSIINLTISMALLYFDIKKINQTLSQESVKEGFDHLPMGLSFYDENGYQIMCNDVMHNLIIEIDCLNILEIDDIMQRLIDISVEQNLPNVIYIKSGRTIRLSGDRVWQFKKIITHQNDAKYIQLTAYDITDIYKLICEENKKTEKLKMMAKDIENLSKDMLKIIREQEILNAKINLHNKMGAVLLESKNYFEQPSSKKKASLLQSYSKVFEMLSGVDQEDKNDNEFKRLKELCKKLNIDMKYTGQILDSKPIRKVTAEAMRQCITNTLKHAGGTEIYVDMSYDKVSISNNGTPPKEKIVEGTGLKSLRQLCEKSGYQMIVDSFPNFILTIIFSENRGF